MNFNNHARCDTVPFSTLRSRQNGRHFADNIFKCILLNENVWIPIKISLNFVTKGPINNIPSLVQIMVWRRPGAKPLSEPMMVSLLTHICVTQPEWVNQNWSKLTPFILYTQTECVMLTTLSLQKAWKVVSLTALKKTVNTTTFLSQCSV